MPSEANRPSSNANFVVHLIVAQLNKNVWKAPLKAVFRDCVITQGIEPVWLIFSDTKSLGPKR